MDSKHVKGVEKHQGTTHLQVRERFSVGDALGIYAAVAVSILVFTLFRTGFCGEVVFRKK